MYVVKIVKGVTATATLPYSSLKMIIQDTYRAYMQYHLKHLLEMT